MGALRGQRLLGWAYRRRILLSTGAVALAALLVAGAYLAGGGGLLGLQTSGILDNRPLDGSPGQNVIPRFDADQDGLYDVDENQVYGTSPDNGDTDRDGMPDGWEAIAGGRYGAGLAPDPLEADAHADPDGDGLSNLQEYEWSVTLLPDATGLRDLAQRGLKPLAYDTDGDGMSDGWEVTYGLNPLDAADKDTDLDGDGLSNLREFQLGTKPKQTDSDGDGLADGDEVLLGLNPALADSDGDGMPDRWERHFGLDPLNPADGVLDADSDGLTNADEHRVSITLFPTSTFDELVTLRLRPNVPDADGDGMPDGWEVLNSLNPLDDGTLDFARGPDGDLDGDGLTNLREFQLGTRPDRKDTDGDGVDDDVEVAGFLITVVRNKVVGNETYRVSSNPRVRDTDGDGLTDGEEISLSTDPASPDTDGDGLDDFREVQLRTSPNDLDTDGDDIDDGEEHEYWTVRRDDARTLADTDPASLSFLVRGNLTRATWTPRQLADLLGPLGDIDGDGKPNLLDPDSDGDATHAQTTDGFELRPTPDADGNPRRYAMDPANGDTDGDGLPDSWEVAYGRFVPFGGDLIWNLNPAKRDSLNLADGRGDGDRDLEDDGLTNGEELVWGTDPNALDTDTDGLPDGWEVFHRYDPLGRVRLDPTKRNTDENLETSEGRAAKDDGEEDFDNDGHVTLVKTGNRWVPGPYAPFTNLAEYLATRERLPVSAKMADVLQSGLSPYKADTDGDGMSDGWEAGFGFNPLARSDADEDADNDGLTNLQEYRVSVDLPQLGAGTHPRIADTDGGLSVDGLELTAANGIVSLVSDPFDPLDDMPDLDQDGDGLTNAQEFALRTNPFDPDTDRDGLLDGPSGGGFLILACTPQSATYAACRALIDAGIVHERRGDDVHFHGERTKASNPRNADTDGDGMPDGWEAYYNLDPTANDAAEDADNDGRGNLREYLYGRPAHWPAMRTWWGGLDPTSGDTDLDGVPDSIDRDQDNDGLDDLNGEDVSPGLDPLNRKPAEALTLEEAFAFRAGRTATGKDLNGNGVPDHLERVRTRIVITEAPTQIEKGVPFTVRGYVEVDDATDDPARNSTLTRVRNMTVLLNLDARSGEPARIFGIGTTLLDGTFSITGVIGKTQTAPRILLASGLAPTWIGADGSWTSDPASVAAGLNHRLVLWTMNRTDVPGAPTLHGKVRDAVFDTRNVSGATTQTLPNVAVRAHTLITLQEAPAAVPVGTPVIVRGTLVDVNGIPIPNAPLTALWLGATTPVTTGAGGTFTLTLATTAPAGTHPLVVRYQPPANGFFTGNATTHALTVQYRTTLSAVPGVPGEGNAGANVTVQTVLRDQNGAPLANRSVEALLGGVRLGAWPTDGEGRATLTIPIPANASGGFEQLRLRFPGADGLLESNVTNPNFEVFERPILRVTAPDITRGEAVRVTGRLTDAAGNGLANQAVTVTWGAAETTVHTGANGLFEAAFTGQTPTLGTSFVQASFAGSRGASLQPVTAEHTFRIVSQPRIDVTGVTVPRGHTVTLNARLLDDTGRPIRDALVNVTWDAEALEEGARTNAQGALSGTYTVPHNAPLGAVLVTFTYDGDPARFLLPVERVVVYHVGTPTFLELYTSQGERGRVRIEADLSDQGGRLEGQTVSLYLDGVLLGNATTTAASPNLVLDAIVPAGTPSGNATLRAVFAGTRTYAPSERAVPFLVIGRTVLTVEAPSEARRGSGLTLEGTLLEENGAPVTGRITFRLNDTVLGTVDVTDGVYRTVLAVPADAPIGPAALRARFDATPSLRGIATERPLRVLDVPTLTVDAPSAPAPGSPPGVGRVTVTLGAGAGAEPLANAVLIVRDTVTATSYQVVTNGRGVAEFPIPALAAGREARLQVSYPGGDNLLATASDVTVAASAPAPTSGAMPYFLAALALLLAIGGGAAWYLLRRARQKHIRAAQNIFEDTANRLLAGDEFKATIFLAYQELEAHLIRSGFQAGPADTPGEIGRGLRAAIPVDDDALAGLIGIFERARYSQATITSEDRTDAVRFFKGVVDSLDGHLGASAPKRGGDA